MRLWMRPRTWQPAFVTLAGCLAIAACKDATQARLIVRTNVPFRNGLSVGVWTNTRSWAPGDVPSSTSAEPWLADGQIGDLVVTPRDKKDGPLTVRMVIGVGRDARTCSDNDAKGCIVAKRKLAFVPNVGLRVPVVLHLACEGVVCSEDTTCNYLGRCVSALIDPQTCVGPEGCVLPGDERVTGTVPLDPRDASTDGATLDAAIETSGAIDASDAGTDGTADALSPRPVAQVAVGGSHACARFNDGSVKCWGASSDGQLGIESTSIRGDGPGEMGANLPAVDLGTGRTALEIACGAVHSCARLDNNSVKCWGFNDSGQLGIGDAVRRGHLPGTMGDVLPTVDLGTGRSALAIAASGSNTCARLDNGTLKCWGANFDGQLGLGDTTGRGTDPGEMGDTLPPVDVGGQAVTQVSLGGGHVCAVLADATLKCWGSNIFGRLGLGDTLTRGDAAGTMGANLPTVSLGVGRAVLQVTSGTSHNCARLDNGQVKCWGFNFDGQLGLGDQSDRGGLPGTMGDTLNAVDLGGTATLLAAGTLHTCAVVGGLGLKCWGNNANGQLGVGDVASRGDTAFELGNNLPVVDLGPGRTATQTSTGTNFTCARLDNAEVKCWGTNIAGQLGLGDTTSRGSSPGQLGANLLPIQL